MSGSSPSDDDSVHSASTTTDEDQFDELGHEIEDADIVEAAQLRTPMDGNEEDEDRDYAYEQGVERQEGDDDEDDVSELATILTETLGPLGDWADPAAFTGIVIEEVERATQRPSPEALEQLSRAADAIEVAPPQLILDATGLPDYARKREANGTPPEVAPEAHVPTGFTWSTDQPQDHMQSAAAMLELLSWAHGARVTAEQDQAAKSTVTASPVSERGLKRK